MSDDAFTGCRVYVLPYRRSGIAFERGGSQGINLLIRYRYIFLVLV